MEGPWTAMGHVRLVDWLPRVLALVLPMLVLTTGLVAVRWVEPPVDTELRDELIEAMDEGPDLVVVGNSITKAGIDPDQLGRDLSLSVALLTVPGSEAPAWYAVVKNVVLHHERRPRAILVANRADGLLAVTARTDQDRLRLDQLMTAHEPVLVSKVLDPHASWVEGSDFDRRRTQHRRAVLDRLRDVAAALVGFSSPDAVSAHNRVFADEHLDYALARNAWPSPSVAEEPVTTAPDTSLVVDLAQLARDHGVKIAFVHVPSAPGTPDLVTEDQMHELLRVLNARGMGYVARPRKPVRAAWFADPVHLRPAGRKHFTTFLGKRIRQLKLHLPRAPVPQAPLPPRPPSVTRSVWSTEPLRTRLAPVRGTCAHDGVPTALARLFGVPGRDAPITPGSLVARGLPPAWPVTVSDAQGPLNAIPRPARLRRDCRPGTFSLVPTRLSLVPRRPTRSVAIAAHREPTVRLADEGSLTWVLPGSTLTVTATEPWDETRGPPAFQVLAHTFGPDERAPTVALKGLGEVPWTAHGGLWRAVAQGGPRDWEMTVASPVGGPLVAIHGLTVGLGKRRTSFLASGRDQGQLALDLIGRPLAEARPRWTTPLPAVPQPVSLVWSPDGTGHFEAPEVLDLTDRLTGRCSPLAVFEDGRPLDRHEDCDAVRTEPGTQCHIGQEIRFHPSPGQRDLARYTLAFDRTSGRACQTAVWLLPGDEVRVKASRQSMRRFFAGAHELHLTARRFGPPPSNEDVATITLVRGNASNLSTTVRLAELEDGLTQRLPSRLGPAGDPVELAVRNHATAQAVLFQKATLVELLPSPTTTARATP